MRRTSTIWTIALALFTFDCGAEASGDHLVRFDERPDALENSFITRVICTASATFESCAGGGAAALDIRNRQWRFKDWTLQLSTKGANQMSAKSGAVHLVGDLTFIRGGHIIKDTCFKDCNWDRGLNSSIIARFGENVYVRFLRAITVNGLNVATVCASQNRRLIERANVWDTGCNTTGSCQPFCNIVSW